MPVPMDAKLIAFGLALASATRSLTLETGTELLTISMFGTEYNFRVLTSSNDVPHSEPVELLQNQPNPFNEETKIGFNLPEASTAKLTIFDELGRTVKVITNSFSKGYNEITFVKNAFLGQNTEGVFFYKLDTPTHSATKRMVILR